MLPSLKRVWALSLNIFHRNAWSSFRPLSKILHCCHEKCGWTVFSSTVAFLPWRKAMDHWLGKLFSSQLPNPDWIIGHFVFSYVHQKRSKYGSYDKVFNVFYPVFTHPYAIFLSKKKRIRSATLRIPFFERKKKDLHVLNFLYAFKPGQDQTHFLRERGDLNPRPSVWQTDALTICATHSFRSFFSAVLRFYSALPFL